MFFYQFTSLVSDFPEGLSPDSPANSAVQCNSGLYKRECATVCKILDCKLSSVSASVHHRTAHFPLLHIWDYVRLIRKQTQTNPMISFHIQPYDILSHSLKIASILCVWYYENWFNSHVKDLSSLRSSP